MEAAKQKAEEATQDCAQDDCYTKRRTKRGAISMHKEAEDRLQKWTVKENRLVLLIAELQ